MENKEKQNKLSKTGKKGSNERREYHKKYYQDHKNKINTQCKDKIRCKCGSVISKRSLAPHKKTKKHISVMKKLPELYGDIGNSFLKDIDSLKKRLDKIESLSQNDPFTNEEVDID